MGTSGLIVRSPDRTSWEVAESSVASNLFGTAWNDDLWVVAGLSGTIATSPDGMSWTERESGTEDRPFDVIWDGERWLTISDGGRVRASIDGTAWSLISDSAVFASQRGLATRLGPVAP